MIAWIMAVAGELAGNPTWAIRVWAALFGTITVGLGYALARRMFDARTAFWFALVLGLAPFAAVQNLVLTTDAPLLLFWTASLLALWCWVDTDSADERGRALGVLTVTLGLVYLSKQTMLAFPAFAFLFLVTDREVRGRLLTPAEYRKHKCPSPQVRRVSIGRQAAVNPAFEAISAGIPASRSGELSVSEGDFRKYCDPQPERCPAGLIRVSAGLVGRVVGSIRTNSPAVASERAAAGQVLYRCFCCRGE